MSTISIARDFSRTPGPRFSRLGPFSGEEFRARLIQELKKSPTEAVEVVLDGTEGYGSSFLEEAFGGLVRAKEFAPEVLRRRLRIKAEDRLYKTYELEARKYMEDAEKALAG